MGPGYTPLLYSVVSRLLTIKQELRPGVIEVRLTLFSLCVVCDVFTDVFTFTSGPLRFNSLLSTPFPSLSVPPRVRSVLFGRRRRYATLHDRPLVLCCAGAVLCCAVLVLCCAVLCWCCVVLCCAVLVLVLCCAVLVLCCAVLCCAV